MDGVITKDAVQHFISNGYIRLENAFSREVADAAREILWNDIEGDPKDQSTWTRPVVRLGMYSEEPFQQAANTSVLHSAFDQLIGTQRWIPCRSMGTFPVRFPSVEDPGDTGWHVDASFPGAAPDNYFEWRVNVRSRGRALLMLFLFSDVGDQDAPTLLRVGSHVDVARLLSGEGDNGLSFMELAERIHTLPERKIAMATGKAGTVYLCHPFIVHAAQRHTGTEPRFVAQPSLPLRGELDLDRSDGGYSPLEQSVRSAVR